MDYQDIVAGAAEHLRGLLPDGFLPAFGLTLGTGLSGLDQAIDVIQRIPYRERYPVSRSPPCKATPASWSWATLAGKPVAALAGRFHLYEGYSPKEVTLPVRVLSLLGAGTFVFCSAAGGLDLGMRSGRAMLIRDHINLTGQNPLTGPNLDAWGERFPDMSQTYDPGLRELAKQVAAENNIQLYDGVYVGLTGPSMETPAETRMLRTLGADAVGMSTVLEVIAARHHGLKVLAFAAISNINDPDDMQPAPIELVIENAAQAGQDLVTLIPGVLEKLA